jgi:hypothetical protein
MSKTTGLEPLRDFIKYSLYSGFVENAPRPVSGLVVAEAERGKSTEARKWEGLGVMTLQDLTSFGIARTISEMSDEDRRTLHHIIIPDLEKIGSRNRNVRDELLAMFRIVMDEGLKDSATGRLMLHLREPIVLGMLMCTTPEDIGDKRSVFRTLSFQSRVIPFTYDYSDQLKVNIIDFVDSEEHAIKEKFVFKRKEKVKVKLPIHYSTSLNPYALQLAKRLERFSRKSPIETTEERGGRLIGIRTKENLMTLLKAIALYHGRTTVKKEDFLKLKKLYSFMNYKFKKLDEKKHS